MTFVEELSLKAKAELMEFVAWDRVRLNRLTREQLVEAVLQACACGDFENQVTVMGKDVASGVIGSQVTYVPGRRVKGLEEEVARLRKQLELIRKVLDA